MHRVLFQRFVDEARGQKDAADQRNADLLYAVETYPDEAAELLFTRYVEPARVTCGGAEESDEEDTASGSPPRRKRKRRLRLEVQAGVGFRLLEGPNVVMFFDKDPRHHPIGLHPVVVKRAATCQNRVEFEEANVDGERLLQDCDRGPFFAALETRGSAAFRNLICVMAKHLSVADIVSCSLVCKSWSASLNANRALWNHHHERLTRRLCGTPPIPVSTTTTTRSLRRACLLVSFAGMDAYNERHMRAFRSYFRDRVTTGLWGRILPRMFSLIQQRGDVDSCMFDALRHLGEAVTRVAYSKRPAVGRVHCTGPRGFGYECQLLADAPVVAVRSLAVGWSATVSLQHVVESYVRWVEKSR